MEIIYPWKKTKSEIIESKNYNPLPPLPHSWNNLICAGDNWDVLHSLKDNPDVAWKIDLIYIDPPFATNSDFKYSEDRANSISKNKGSETAYEDRLVDGEFLEYLRERLILMRELLSDQGSIYLHIDYKIGHYVKIIMDEVFWRTNFRNDIARIKCNPKNFSRKAYWNVKDLILFFSKTPRHIWNEPMRDFEDGELDKRFGKVDAEGRRFTTIPLHAPGETVNWDTWKEWKWMLPPEGRHWRSSPMVLDEWDNAGLIHWSKNWVPRKIIYADETRNKGKKWQDIWEFKDPQYPKYPTEKNIDMLKLIISASSNENSIILDCFCGSGTTLEAAETLWRRWIGVDKSKIAHMVTTKRMTDLNAEFDYLEVGLD